MTTEILVLTIVFICVIRKLMSILIMIRCW
jgi:hypothetical protein